MGSGLAVLSRTAGTSVLVLGFLLWTFGDLGISLKFSQLISSSNRPVLRKAGAGRHHLQGSHRSVCCYFVLALIFRFITLPFMQKSKVA